MLRRISTTGKAKRDRSAVSDALLPVGASLLVPLFALGALNLPVGVIERIAAPVLGQLTAAVRLPVPPAEPQGSQSMRGRTPIGGSADGADPDAVHRGASAVPQIVAIAVRGAEFDVGGQPSEALPLPGPAGVEVVDSGSEASAPLSSSEPTGPVSFPDLPGSPTDSNPGLGAPSAEDDARVVGDMPDTAPSEASTGGADGAPGDDAEQPDETIDPTSPGNSENAPGQDPAGPGNSENAPGQDPAGPGDSENSPGHDPAGPGNSENAPGHDPAGPGNSENAPGKFKRS